MYVGVYYIRLSDIGEEELIVKLHINIQERASCINGSFIILF